MALQLTKLKIFSHSFVLDGKPSSCDTGIRHKLYGGTAGGDKHRLGELAPTELAWRIKAKRPEVISGSTKALKPLQETVDVSIVHGPVIVQEEGCVFM